MYETRRSAEVTKSKSMSLKSQLKSPFKFLGKTYCGGCKVRRPPWDMIKLPRLLHNTSIRDSGMDKRLATEIS